jgi:uncharacterized protein (TIGR01777 family)
MPENQTNKKQKKLSVLITGGSGLIGKYLTSLLLAKGYSVSHLSRNENHPEGVKVFRWDPEKMMVDSKAFEGTDFIIHLAGANIGEKRWTRKRKNEILTSRVISTRLIHKSIAEGGIRLKAFISASATGFYGAVTSSKIFAEDDPPGTDFLGSVCKKCEEAADLFSSSGIRTVKIRTGVVLEKNDSALSKLMVPAKFGFLIQTGTGLQYMPWIHIKDLCNIYLKAIEDSAMTGAFNAAAPQNVTHTEFMQTLARVMKVRIIAVPVPGFVIRAVFGEMSDVILKGSRVSSEKILNSGYAFCYNMLDAALSDIVGD